MQSLSEDMQNETLNFQTPNSQGHLNLCCTFEATTTKRGDKTPFSWAARRGFSFSTSSLCRIKWKCEGRGAAARMGQHAVRNPRLRAGRKKSERPSRWRRKTLLAFIFSTARLQLNFTSRWEHAEIHPWAVFHYGDSSERGSLRDLCYHRTHSAMSAHTVM